MRSPAFIRFIVSKDLLYCNFIGSSAVVFIVRSNFKTKSYGVTIGVE
jgi:hypothetical protein